ncbi:hypothetical protein, partial [Acinetobacter baumannii]|uniref:hypothetical protein n=1 Tax=Acinetobacter baumannii TaxID=470 RepID=UPI0033958C89
LRLKASLQACDKKTTFGLCVGRATRLGLQKQPTYTLPWHLLGQSLGRPQGPFGWSLGSCTRTFRL